MKKVLHISKYYYPYIGGVEMTARYLAVGLNDFENRVVCFNTEKQYKEDVIDGIKIYRMSNDLFVARQSISWGYQKHLKKIFEDYIPDIIHFHCPNPFVYPILLSVLPKETKLVLHWHLDIVKQKLIYPFIKIFETRLLKRADLICTTSPQYRDDSKPLRPYVDKIKILQSAIDVNKLLKKEDDDVVIQNIKNKYDNKSIVFFVGRHVEYKGLQYLIEAEKYIENDCAIVIAGSGPLTDSLKELSKGSSRIHFIGRISDDEVRCYLKASTIFAFPSITKNEAFGLSLAEAMYCGAVPVTFYIEGSGVNWVSVKNETGLEVPNKDSIKYAKAVDKLLLDESLRFKFSKNSSERIKKMFTVEEEVRVLKKYFNDL